MYRLVVVVAEATERHLSSLPNRIFTNGRSSSSCVFTQQGRKGINQDAMIMWEDFMVEDVTFCGIFDGHGPHGHLVARKVRDTLSMKLSSFRNAFESRGIGLVGVAIMGIWCRRPLIQQMMLPGKSKSSHCGKKLFLKAYKAMDKELGLTRIWIASAAVAPL